jgi:hypothetical protein
MLETPSIVRRPIVENLRVAGQPAIARQQRGRVTNRPRKMAIDGRGKLGRRVRDLADAYASGLGGWPNLTELQAAAVRRAAELCALCEQERAVALREGRGDPVGLVRLEGMASRAVAKLNLSESGKREREHEPSLHGYLRSKAAAP